MSYPVYYVPAGDVLPIFFSTYGKTNGESLTMSGLAVTDIEIYKDGSTTQRASDAGYTLLDTDGIDFDGLTGIHGFSIDTGDNTDAGFYTVGAWFHVVVSAVTVDSQTVSFIAAAFRLMPAESVAGKPKVDVDAFGGTAGTFASGRPEVNTSHIAGSSVSTTSAQIGVNVVQISADATAADNAEAFFDGTGYAGTGNVIPTVTTLTGHTAQTGDAYAIVNHGTYGNSAIKTQVGNIETDTQDLQSRLPSHGVTNGSVATNGSNSATSFDTDLTQTETDHWKDAWLVITSGDLAGQVKRVTAYDGTTKVITVSGGFSATPADAVTFTLINR